MTSHTVEWTSTAEDQLADIWLRSSSPKAVTKAQADIDALLMRDPLRHGVEVREDLRKVAIPPLTVYYTVDAAQQRVEVSAVAYTP
jgi:hypothetical protein